MSAYSVHRVYFADGSVGGIYSKTAPTDPAMQPGDIYSKTSKPRRQA